MLAFLFWCSHLLNSRQVHERVCVCARPYGKLDKQSRSLNLWIANCKMYVGVLCVPYILSNVLLPFLCFFHSFSLLCWNEIHTRSYNSCALHCTRTSYTSRTHFVLLTIMLDDFIWSKHVLCLVVALECNSMKYTLAGEPECVCFTFECVSLFIFFFSYFVECMCVFIFSHIFLCCFHHYIATFIYKILRTFFYFFGVENTNFVSSVMAIRSVLNFHKLYSRKKNNIKLLTYKRIYHDNNIPTTTIENQKNKKLCYAY